MQVQVKIILSEDDMAAGITVDHAISVAFPKVNTAATTGLPKREELKGANLMVGAEEILLGEPTGTDAPFDGTVGECPEFAEQLEADEPPPRSDVELDSAGVPWDASIHNSNKKPYASGPEQGRWMWRRGVDKAEAAAKALALAAVASPATPAATTPAATTPAVGTPTAENNTPAVGTPTAENNTPAVTTPAVTTPAAAADGISWPDFLTALRAAGMQAADVTPLLASHNVDKLALLATNHAARIDIAATLGLSA